MILNQADKFNGGTPTHQVITFNDTENAFIFSDDPTSLSKQVAQDVTAARESRATVNGKQLLACVAGASVVGAAAGGALYFLPGELTKTFVPPLINGLTATIGSGYFGMMLGDYCSGGDISKIATGVSSGGMMGSGIGGLMAAAYCLPQSLTTKCIVSTVSGAINGAIIGAGACYHRATTSSAKSVPASGPAPAVPGKPALTQSIPSLSKVETPQADVQHKV